jgi:hypothetical protein
MSTIDAIYLSGSYIEPDGTQDNPFVDLNVKRIPINVYHKIKENRQNIVTETQFIDGVLIIDGVNTVL